MTSRSGLVGFEILVVSSVSWMDTIRYPRSAGSFGCVVRRYLTFWPGYTILSFASLFALPWLPSAMTFFLTGGTQPQICGSLVGWDSLLTFSEPELVSLSRRVLAERSSSPAAFLKSLADLGRALAVGEVHHARQEQADLLRILQSGLRGTVLRLRGRGDLGALDGDVELVGHILPLFAMSATEDAASVVASASYTRIFDLSDVRSQM